MVNENNFDFDKVEDEKMDENKNEMNEFIEEKMEEMKDACNEEIEENDNKIEEDAKIITDENVETEEKGGEQASSTELEMEVKEVDNDSEKLMDDDAIEKLNVDSKEVTGLSEEEIEKLEKEVPIDWNEIEFEKANPDIPKVTDEDLKILTVTKLVSKSRAEMDTLVDLLRNIIKNSRRSKDEHDKKAFENARSYLARMQSIARKEATQAISGENIYAILRKIGYTKLALFISKKTGKKLSEVVDDISNRGYYVAYIDAVLRDIESVKKAIRNLGNLHYKQMIYQDIIDSLTRACKAYQMEEAFKLTFENMSHIMNSFTRFIEFGKVYSLLTVEERMNAFVENMGPEALKNLQEEFKKFDADGYYMNNDGIYISIFDPMNDNVRAFEQAFDNHKENKNVHQFVNDSNNYAVYKLQNLIKKDEFYLDVQKALYEKLQNNPVSFTYKDFLKLNDVDYYVYIKQVMDTFKSDPDKNMRYFARQIFLMTYTEIFYESIKELFDFIENSDYLPDDFEEGMKLAEINTDDLVKQMGGSHRMDTHKANLVKHALILDMGLSIYIVQSPINETIKDYIDKILNKNYQEESPNIKNLLSIDRDTSRRVLALTAHDYTKNILDVWASILNSEVEYKDWELKVKLPPSLDPTKKTNKKKKK